MFIETSAKTAENVQKVTLPPHPIHFNFPKTFHSVSNHILNKIKDGTLDPSDEVRTHGISVVHSILEFRDKDGK